MWAFIKSALEGVRNRPARRRPGKGRRRAAGRRCRPGVEALECRLVPARVLNVTTPLDEMNPNDGVLSLREAIGLANADLPGDAIVLPPGTYTSTSGAFAIRQSLTILGSGASATVIDGNSSVTHDRVFDVRGGASVQFGDGPATGLTIRNGSAVTDNATSAGEDGGGIRTDGGAVTLVNSTVSGNKALNDGGGIFTSGGAVTLVNSTVSGNEADRDGIIDPSPFVVGGGIAGGTVTLTNSTVSGNSAPCGGAGGVSGGTVMLTNSTVSGNSALGGAGGIDAGGAVTLTNSTVSGNNTSLGGVGGIDAGGAVTLTNSTVSGNQSGDTGGISTSGPVALTDSTVSGNSGFVVGGIDAGGAVTLTNSTISGNSSLPGTGGIHAGGPLRLTNVTVTGNSSGYGGAAILSLGGGTLTNTIVAGNHGADVSGAFTSGGHNLIGDATGSTDFADGVNGDLVGPYKGIPLDPKLGPLQDNGGPTFTHAPLPGSPAIDAGLDGVVAADQRGVARPQGHHTDIGAYELRMPTHFVVWTGGTVTTPGRVFTLTVIAADDQGNPVSDYLGTIQWTDAVGTTNSYTFTAADHGVHSLPDAAVLWSLGRQTVAVTDPLTGVTGSLALSVVSQVPAASVQTTLLTGTPGVAQLTYTGATPLAGPFHVEVTGLGPLQSLRAAAWVDASGQVIPLIIRRTVDGHAVVSIPTSLLASLRAYQSFRLALAFDNPFALPLNFRLNLLFGAL